MVNLDFQDKFGNEELNPVEVTDVWDVSTHAHVQLQGRLVNIPLTK